VAARGIAVQLGAGEVPPRGDQLPADALAHLALGVARPVPLAGHVLGRASRRAHRHAAHRLDPGRDDDVLRAGHDRLGGEVHRLLAAAALPVHRRAGHRLRESRAEGRPARDVGRLLADLGDVSGDDVVDPRRVDPGPLDQRLERLGEQVGRMHRRQGPTGLALADRRPNCLHDDRVPHGASSVGKSYRLIRP
jgi:hypothetical protein